MHNLFTDFDFIMTKAGIGMNFNVMDQGHLRLKGQGLMTTLTIDLAGYMQINIIHRRKVRGHDFSDLVMTSTGKQVKTIPSKRHQLRDREFIDASSFQCQKVTVVTS